MTPALRMSCMRVMLRKWSRSPSGAQTIVFRIICRADASGGHGRLSAGHEDASD